MDDWMNVFTGIKEFTICGPEEITKIHRIASRRQPASPICCAAGRIRMNERSKKEKKKS